MKRLLSVKALSRLVPIRSGLVVAAVLFLVTGGAQGQTITWTDQFGTSGTDVAQAMATGDSGYVAGYTTGDLDGVGPGPFGAADAFIRKYDNDGNVVWTRQFGTSDSDVAFAIATGDSVYVAGYTCGTLPGEASAGECDAFVRKYDNAGNVVWTDQFGTSGLDQAFAIATGASVYVAGYTCGTLPEEASAGDCDAFVRKYDNDGNVLWTDQFGTSNDDLAYAIAIGDSVYVAGYTCGTLPGEASAGGCDAFVRKYDNDGNVLWTDQFGTSDDDAAQAIATGASVYVAGYTCGTLPEEASAGDCDAFVRKYDNAGNVVWTDQFGTSGFDIAFAIATGDSVYVAGYTNGSLEGDNAGDADAFVRKYDNAGNVVWTDQFGTSEDDIAYAIATGASVYVAGYTGGDLDGGGNAGLDDAFVLKIVETCNGVAATIVGTDGNDVLVGTAGPDVIVGKKGNDVLRGKGGNDLLCGNEGRDRLYGGDGKDKLFGGPGNDYLDGEAGKDTGRGGVGTDKCVNIEKKFGCEK